VNRLLQLFGFENPARPFEARLKPILRRANHVFARPAGAGSTSTLASMSGRKRENAGWIDFRQAGGISSGRRKRRRAAAEMQVCQPLCAPDFKHRCHLCHFAAQRLDVGPCLLSWLSVMTVVQPQKTSRAFSQKRDVKIYREVARARGCSPQSFAESLLPTKSRR